MEPNLTINGQEIYVCQNGAVYGHKKLLKKRLNRFGYEVVTLGVGKRRAWNVHRLVALAHIPNPLNLETVNHVSGYKLDNSVDNLEWCTRERNVKLAQDEPVIAISMHDPSFGLYYSCQADAHRDGFQQPNISKCLTGERNSHKGYQWERVNG